MATPVAVWYVVLAAGALLSLGTLYHLASPGGRWGRRVRSRLVFGLPWGTVLACVGLVAFYLLVQDGLGSFGNPVVIPFRAWSYFYPTGMLAAGFAHAGPGHLTGNLVGTLVFGTLAEYAWSHYPRKRGRSTFSSLRTNPYARIVAWVVAVFVVGVLSSLFGLGPVIGFSGVVFAFAGFALVRYPLASIAAVLLANVVNLVYAAFRSPVVRQTAGESFARPWWAGVAIQGHLLGVLLGVVLGLALVYDRDVRPTASHVWLATLVLAADRGFWALYVIEGSETYRLFRALGVTLVFLLAALVATGAVATPRDLLARIDLSRREAAYMLVVATLFALAFVAVPFNLFVVDDPHAGLGDAEPVQVEDYTVFYAEGVENQFIPAVPLPSSGNDTTERVNASGVIVVSERRNIWWEEVSKRRLAATGEATIRLGGLTWRSDVRVTRRTWTLVGGESTYHVRLGRSDAGIDGRPVVFRADPATADVRLDGRNVSIEPVGDRFDVLVTRENRTLGRTVIPGDGNTTSAGGIVLEREGGNLFARAGQTRVRVARRSG